MVSSLGSVSPISHTLEDGENDEHAKTRGEKPEVSKSHRHRTWTGRIFKWIWWPEILAVLLAILSLIAIVILLALRKNKPQPQWPSLLTINSLVAIFSSILKAALLFSVAECLGELKWTWFAVARQLSDFDRFDSAGRGPWGAFLLLIKRPGNMLASLGTIVTILTLAIDPFAQQILQFYTCRIPFSGTQSARVARTNNYTEGIYSIAVGTPGVNARMTASLYRGLLDPPANASSLMSNVCLTGNCTFPEVEAVAYSSLAMCTKVEDISSEITGEGPDPDSSYSSYAYKLPSGLTLFGGQAMTTAVVGDEKAGQDAPLVTIEALLVRKQCPAPKALSSSTSECGTSPWAVRMSISPCVQGYHRVSFNSSIFLEHESSNTMLSCVSPSQFYSLAGDYPALPGVDCSPSAAPQGKKTARTAALSNGNYAADWNNTQQQGSDLRYYDPQCVYAVGLGPTSGLQSVFGTFFGGPKKPNKIVIPRGINSQVVGDPWLKSLYGDARTPDINSTTRYVMGLADAMTATMRENGDPSNSAPALGSAFATQTCVGVQWAWLTFPVILVALTLAFTILTIDHSRRYTRLGRSEYGRMPWKSSSLPLLWCGVRDNMKLRHGRFDDVDDMKEASDNVNVTLRREVWFGDQLLGERDDVGEDRWALKEE